jgi:hypothetical protein
MHQISYRKLNHYALKVHRLRRGLKSRLFLIINLLKCHVVKWISAECFATESLAPKVHSFGLTLWDSKATALNFDLYRIIFEKVG